MARTYVLEVVDRCLCKKAKFLRREGFIPGEAYGPGLESNKHFMVHYPKFESIIEKLTLTSFVELKIKNAEGAEEVLHGFVKSIQRHKVTDKFQHIDFYVPSQDHKMTIEVPLKLSGTAQGVVMGGLLEAKFHEIPVELLPKDVMEELVIDVTNLNIGDHLTVADLKAQLPASAKVLMDETEIIATIATVSASDEITGEASEPEATKEKAKK